MRNHPIVNLEKYRVREGPMSSWTNQFGNTGAFIIGHNNQVLMVIASDGLLHENLPESKFGLGWEHVSVSIQHRCPTWEEMCFVKELFWKDDEVVMQLHPAKSEHRSLADTCLHMWRPLNADIPLPPPELVIVRGEEEAKRTGSPFYMPNPR